MNQSVNLLSDGMLCVDRSQGKVERSDSSESKVCTECSVVLLFLLRLTAPIHSCSFGANKHPN